MNSLGQSDWKEKLKKAVFGLFLVGFLASQGYAQIGLAPTITVQPSDQIVPIGATVVFQVGATSLTSMSYKWYRNNAVILGATFDTCIITNVQTTDAGYYRVDVKNLTGTTSSSNVILYPLPGPNTPLTISSPCLVTSGCKISVTGPALYNYVIQASSDAANWTSLATNFVPTGSTTFTDARGTTAQNLVAIPAPGVGAGNMRFYRALRPPSAIHEQNAASGRSIQIRYGEEGAQSFRHGIAGGSSYSITKIVLRLSRETVVPNANLDFYIGTGTNAGAVAGSTVFINPASITNASSGASFQTYEIVYAAPVGPFVAGTTYYLNFEFDPTNGRRLFLEGADGSAYANGTYYRAGSDNGQDARFEIWGQ